MSRPRPELSRDSIAAAALSVLDRDGSAKFSMRSVAALLGVTPMSLYHHVSDRSELVTLMIDAAMREVPMPTPSGEGWRDDVWNVALWLRAGHLRHPALGALVHEMRSASPAMYAFGEYWVGLWRLSSIPDEHVFDAALASLSVVVSLVMSANASDGSNSSAPKLDQVPNLRHAMSVVRDAEGSFELAVRGALEGIEARLIGVAANSVAAGGYGA